MAGGFRGIAREVGEFARDVRGKDPEVRILGGDVRVRIAGSADRRGAVEALRRLADTLDDPDAWREVVGEA